ncbi:hypothetical protein RRG08_016408 [Elysia crispata]|uniref:Uncharacterized protein n=1 Tax=Elysia crispata TaxID=231223 RepID=A0AAE0Y9S0_9GAST|nr:hypothetical protein RRG08_016408 [Elysia crispata]
MTRQTEAKHDRWTCADTQAEKKLHGVVSYKQDIPQIEDRPHLASGADLRAILVLGTEVFSHSDLLFCGLRDRVLTPPVWTGDESHPVISASRSHPSFTQGFSDFEVFQYDTDKNWF